MIINNETDYQKCLLEIERLWGATDGSPEEKRFDEAVAAVSAYDKARPDIPHPGDSYDGLPD